MPRPDTCLHLMSFVDSPKLFDMPLEELLPLQLAAANDLYRQDREKIAVLRQRGEDCGVGELKNPADIVPLLFSHSTYKSYPERLISDKRWDLLTRWYNTVSAVPIEIDLAGIENVDDWVDRLWKNEYFLHATSGTTGKCSFLNHTKSDRDFVEHYLSRVTGWPNPLDPDGPKYRFYRGLLAQGPQTPMHWFGASARLFGRPDASFALGREPLTVSYINRVGAMRKAMAENKISPDEITAFEDEMREREAQMAADVLAMAKDIADHRDEPMIIMAWMVMHALLTHLREFGVREGDFKDVFLWGTARKRLQSPVPNTELEADARRFFNAKQVFGIYGMSELSVPMPECEAGAYHVPPWIMVLPLDRNGNHLLANNGGVVEGRGGFLDLSREGRWGGIISGDKIEVNYAGCACGRAGPVILDTISRFSDVGDEKVDCGGSFDAYVRGVLDEQS
jgi:hypothetical protein